MGDKEIHSGSWKRVGRDFRHALWGWLFPRDPPIVHLDFRATGCPEAPAFFAVLMKIEIQIELCQQMK